MRALVLLLPLIGIACSGSDDSGTDTTAGDDDDDVVYTGCLAGGISVDPGTGPDAFVALSSGDEVTLVHGPQGGWHIDVAGMVSNTEELVQVDATFVDTSSGTLVAGDQTGVRQALVGWDDTGCSGTFYGVRTFVDDIAANVTQADICALEGAELELTLTVTALEGDPPAVAEVTTMVTAVLDPADVAPCAKL